MVARVSWLLTNKIAVPHVASPLWVLVSKRGREQECNLDRCCFLVKGEGVVVSLMGEGSGACTEGQLGEGMVERLANNWAVGKQCSAWHHPINVNQSTQKKRLIFWYDYSLFFPLFFPVSYLPRSIGLASPFMPLTHNPILQRDAAKIPHREVHRAEPGTRSGRGQSQIKQKRLAANQKGRKVQEPTSDKQSLCKLMQQAPKVLPNAFAY